MKIQFICLASGSSGNCFYLGTETYGILIDAGIPVRVIKQNLKDVGIPFERVCAVFVTHDHADHIDRPFWRELARLGCKAKFLVPAYVAADVVRDTGLKRTQVIGFRQGESITIGGIKATAVASAHERLEFDRRGRSRNLGFVLETKGRRIYHSGDCCLYEGLQTTLAKFGRFDAAFLPINGRDAWRLTHDFIGCMDEHEAVELAGDLGVKVLVPGHHDMFRPNLGNVKECVAFAKAKYPKLKVIVPQTGKEQRI